MKKLLIFCILFGALTGQAQVFYRISGNGLTQDSYLFGTIHMLPKAEFKLGTAVQRAFRSCSALTMEVDIDMSVSQQMALAQQAIFENGQTLESVMTPSDFTKLKRYCLDTLEWNTSKFERSIHLKPLFFSSLLVKESLHKMASFEQEFNKLAHKQNKKTGGLESIQEQLNIFNSMSMETQVSMLQNDYAAGQKAYDELLQLYLHEDLAGLYAAITAESASYPDFNRIFLNERNQNWIPLIAEQAKKEATFFAVGAGHLAGPEGVVALLRAQGFTVTALKQN
ncbi:MAG: hypothetical protein RLZZ301_716 [Bacteroidota bacterium]|jgi:uncharacterized protein YbaP (TraB family)